MTTSLTTLRGNENFILFSLNKPQI